MRRTLTLLTLLSIPAAALALDFTNVSGRYTDAPFSKSEAAGISVLTEIGAVSGNPDGTFAPAKQLNRAEFTKIALLTQWDADDFTNGANCFPDVKAADWFSHYVCPAKERAIVEGNPDGLFHPERAVNYAEAVKILVEMFDYTLPEPAPNERWAWYTGYIKAAEEHKVALSGLEPDTFLTRGQMARLAAAFYAESVGQLTQYRQFEMGRTPSSVSSTSSSTSSVLSSSSTSSISSIASISSSSASSSSSPSALFPALSHFLVAGQTSPVILDGVVNIPDENAEIRLVEIELRREIRSLESLILVDGANTQIATVTLQTYNNTDKTKWRVELSSGSYVLPKNTPVRLGIRANIKSVAGGAISNELFELKTWSMQTIGKTTQISRQTVPTDVHYPFHQTAFGRITAIRNDLATSMTVQQGTARQLGSFTITAQSGSGASLELESLTFLLQSTDVTVSNLRIGGANPAQQEGCATEYQNDQRLITCMVPESMRSISANPLTMTVYGDLSVAAAKQSGIVHLASKGAGGIGSEGSARWTDGSGTFNWVESDIQLESGPTITVTK